MRRFRLRVMSRPVRTVLMIGAVIALVVVAGVWGSTGGEGEVEGLTGGEGKAGAPAVDEQQDSSLSPADEERDAAATAASGTLGEGEAGAGGAGIDSLEHAAGRKVITDATIQIQVDQDGFDSAFDRALQLADRYGGHVVSSQSNGSSEDRAPRSGTVTLRIPELSFTKAVEDASGLGTVLSRQISSEDVTEEYVDLQARLENAQAQEAALQRLLGRADNVDEILEVRNVLSTVQQQVEQFKGRLRYLEEHTSMSTLTLVLHEEGVQVASTAGWGFVDALEDSARAFVGTVNAIVIGLGGLLPVLIVLGVIAMIGYRILRPVLAEWAPKPPGGSPPSEKADGS